MTESKQFLRGIRGDYENFTVELLEYAHENYFDSPGYPVSGDQIARVKGLSYDRH